MAVSACFAGSFDPTTRGHLDLVRRAAPLFERLVVAVGSNVEKHAWFRTEERVSLLAHELHDLAPAVSVRAFDGLLVDFCRSEGLSVLVRGLRSGGDFDDELVMAQANRRLAPKIESLCLFGSAEHLMISSRLVKEIARGGGPLELFVTPRVAEAIRRRLAEEDMP